MATLSLLRLSMRGSHAFGLLKPQSILIKKLPPVLGTAATEKSISLSSIKKQADSEVPGHSHTNHWVAERVAAVSLIGIIPAAYFLHPPAMDYILCAGIVLHTHWGVAGVSSDYVHGYPSATGERRYVSWLPSLVKIAVLTMSATAFYGLCYFNYNDVGVIDAIRMLWDADKKKAVSV